MPEPGVGDAFSGSRDGRGYVVYGETLLPADRRSRLESNTAFSDLDYAIYFGHSEQTAELLVTSLKHLPISSRRASATVAFGDRSLTLVVTPRGSLGGTFFRSLPWIVGILGAPSRSPRRCSRIALSGAASEPSSWRRTSTGWRPRTSTCTPSSGASPRPCSMRSCPRRFPRSAA